jgi:hypothetical protein
LTTAGFLAVGLPAAGFLATGAAVTLPSAFFGRGYRRWFKFGHVKGELIVVALLKGRFGEE